MFLKSLELNGFKSFAQKTTLEFPAGITAIVGPNGSGKSNLIDAIRWLLGEREAKNLRGEKAEDLIFAGTPKKPKAPAAEAGLHFDNGSGFFPVDFSEVSVVRRVARDGNSRYFLNKSEARLKDIVDFFGRSRLGVKGLTIINQGNSDLFVRVSPEERRVMIEEILGLKEYQLKKSEAERKLKNTLINLDKVKAILGEILPHLRMLRRQTAKWEKRAEAEKELKDLENRYFSFKLNAIRKSLAVFEPELRGLDKQMAEKLKELKYLEGELGKLELKERKRSDIKSMRRRQNDLLSRRSEVQKEVGRLEAKIELLSGVSENRGKIFNVEEILILIKDVKKALEDGLNCAELEKLKKIIEGLIIKIGQFLERDTGSNSTAIKEFEKLKSDLAGNLVLIDKELTELTEAEQKIADELEGFNRRFREAFEIKEAKKEEINKLEDQKNRILFEKEKLNLRLQDLEGQISQAGRTTKEFQHQDVLLQGEINFPDIERRMFKLRTYLASIGEVDESLVKEAEETEAHYGFLTNQSKDMEKAIADLKNLIKELSERIHSEFNSSLKTINEEFNKFFRLMFFGGSAKLRIKNYELRIKNNGEVKDGNKSEDNAEINDSENERTQAGVDIDLKLPGKKITGLNVLSGGEKSLVSIAALFALVSVSPPPFLVLDEIDAALDEKNSRRFAELVKEFSHKTQFVIVTHNRATMEAADVLYGVTMEEDGASKVLSLKLGTSNRT